MKFRDYIEDHAGFLILSFLFLLMESVLLLFLGITPGLTMIFMGIWFCLFFIYFFVTFHKKKKRMNTLYQLVDHLDQKYLLHEVMPSGGNWEEQCYRDLLYVGNKSMLEHVTDIERNRLDYEEYIEQWVHEIKTPIAAMKLWAENQEGKKKREVYTQLERIEHYVEQALFYARSENVERDFFVQEYDLYETMQEALLQCKYLCTSNRIHVVLKEVHGMVRCDEKWIIFILNQLIENAVKYRKPDEESCLQLYLEHTEAGVFLHVADNGQGIPAQDITRIFDKGFTGENGRKANTHATGIGLYLCKRLCDALGITLSVVSEEGNGCDMILFFPSYNSVRVL